jgi:hypothetical protein
VCVGLLLYIYFSFSNIPSLPWTYDSCFYKYIYASNAWHHTSKVLYSLPCRTVLHTIVKITFVSNLWEISGIRRVLLIELIKSNLGNYILHHTTLPSLWKTLPYSMCTVVTQWMELSVKDGKRVSGKVRYNGAKVWQPITKKDYMWWHTTLDNR